jgi:hypothetical protein
MRASEERCLSSFALYASASSEEVLMVQHSAVPSRSRRVAAFGSISTLLVVLWAAPARTYGVAGAFPVGFWCGIGKAPAGEIVPTPVKGAIGKGILYFALSRGKAGIGGYGHAVLTVRVEKLTGEAVSVSTLQADGEFEDAIGTAVAPALVGSWEISGQVKVIQAGRTFTHPLSIQSKNWKGKLVVEKATASVVSGHWLVPKWKWTARRSQGKPCPGASA